MKPNANIQLLTAAVLSLGGMALLFCGVFIDPKGQIEESVLVAFGESATFAGALFGIDYTYKHKNANNHDNNHPSNDAGPDAGQSRDGNA